MENTRPQSKQYTYIKAEGYSTPPGIGVNLRKECDQDQIQNFSVFFFHSNNILPGK